MSQSHDEWPDSGCPTWQQRCSRAKSWWNGIEGEGTRGSGWKKHLLFASCYSVHIGSVLRASSRCHNLFEHQAPSRPQDFDCGIQVCLTFVDPVAMLALEVLGYDVLPVPLSGLPVSAALQQSGFQAAAALPNEPEVPSENAIDGRDELFFPELVSIGHLLHLPDFDSLYTVPSARPQTTQRRPSS